MPADTPKRSSRPGRGLASSLAGAGVAGVTTVVLALFFWATALFSVRALYRPFEVGVLWIVYLLLAATLVLGARWAMSRHPALGWAAAVGVALAALWHLREQTRGPQSLLVLAILALALGSVCAFLASRRSPPAGRPSALQPLVAGAVCLALLVACYLWSPTLRWHLLRHNTMLGTPLYYLVAKPVPDISAELLARVAEPPPELLHNEPLALASDWRPPNVVVIMVDTLRADALDHWGGDPEVTPNLSQWLENSFRFTDVLANSSWTRPSVASLFTGLLPEEHGARNTDDGIAEGVTTFAEQLSGLGYETAALVTNFGAAGSDAGFARGFDLFHEFTDQPYARADKVNRTLASWLDRRDPAADTPLLLYLHYLDPHDPYLSGDAPSRDRAADYRLAYRRELEFFDLQFLELRSLLQQSLRGSTLVLLTSDHGEEFFEHGLFGHGHSLYQEVLHIPAALGALGGPVNDAFSAAGGDVAARLEGRDFYDLILRVASEPELSPRAWAMRRAREQRYSSLYFTGSGRLLIRPYRRHNLMRALDETDRKLIWSAYGRTHELYDLDADPLEASNLVPAADPSRLLRMNADLDRQVRAWVRASPLATDSEGRKQLRALGYVD